MMKYLADFLTLSRLVIAAMYAGLAFVDLEKPLVFACTLLLLSWTTDYLDGGIARSRLDADTTRFANYDLPIDMIVNLALAFFLAIQGFIPDRWLVLYLFFWIPSFFLFKTAPSVGRFIQTPIYAWLIWLSLQSSPALGWIVIASVGGFLILSWPRFPKEIAATWKSFKRFLQVGDKNGPGTDQ